jgi:hypothetical protein
MVVVHQCLRARSQFILDCALISCTAWIAFTKPVDCANAVSSVMQPKPVQSDVFWQQCGLLELVHDWCFLLAASQAFTPGSCCFWRRS